MQNSPALEGLSRIVTHEEVQSLLVNVEKKVRANGTREVYSRCIGLLDLTSLRTTDSSTSIRAFTQKAVDMKELFPEVPAVAAVCVYPSFIEDAGLVLGDENISLVSTGGGFPHSHTYPEVKVLECAMAVENGADEIDTVLNVGAFLDKDYGLVAGEIELIRQELGEDALLKIILETGVLPDYDAVRNASLLALVSGADFIKTSTGKTAVSATPEAFIVMCEAVRDYFTATGLRKGVKAAGGIRTERDAVLYYTIVEEILGPEWLNPRLFRIGASQVADELLSSIYNEPVCYFRQNRK